MLLQKSNVGGRRCFREVKDAHENLAFRQVVCPIGRAVAVCRNGARTLQGDARMARLNAGPCPLTKQKSPILGGESLRVSNAKTGASGTRGAGTDAAMPFDVSGKQSLLILEDRFAVKNGEATQVMGAVKGICAVVRIKRDGADRMIDNVLKGAGLILNDSERLQDSEVRRSDSSAIVLRNSGCARGAIRAC